MAAPTVVAGRSGAGNSEEKEGETKQKKLLRAKKTIYPLVHMCSGTFQPHPGMKSYGSYVCHLFRHVCLVTFR